MAFGVTEDGFVKKDQATLISEMRVDAKARFGDGVVLEDDSVTGNLISIASERFAKIWDLGQAVYNSFFPDTATGKSLDKSAGFTASTRLGEAKTKVVVRCLGTDTTVLPIGRVVRNPTTQELWLSTEAKTIGEVTTGLVDVIFEAENAGVVSANSGALTEIVTPVVGWDTASNLADEFDIGRAVETDVELRERREDEINTSGGGVIEGMLTKIRQLVSTPTILDVFIFENDTDIIVDSRPPHSLEVVVDGGADQDLFDEIGKTKPGGIQTVGSESGTYVDTQGFNKAVKFSRPADRLVSLEVDYTTAEGFPASGEADAEANVLVFGNALGIGDDVIISQMVMSIDVPGLIIKEIRAALDDITPPIIALDGVLTILKDATGVERSKWDSARIIFTEV